MALVNGIGVFKTNNNQTTNIIKDNDVIRESIYNILTTRKGEVPGNPTFGTNIHRFLFEPNLDQYWDALKIEIMNDVANFEPRALVYNAEFISDGHSLTLFVFFVSLLDYTSDITIISDIT
jgi:phage baseplate assembly protein W